MSSRAYLVRLFTAFMAVVVFLISCKTPHGSSEKAAATVSAIASNRGFPRGQLGAAVLKLRPVRVRDTGKYATVIPLNKRQGLTAIIGLSADARADSFDVGGVRASAIAAFPNNKNLALLSFGSDDFADAVPVNPNPLKVGNQVAIAGIGPSVGTVEGAALYRMILAAIFR